MTSIAVALDRLRELASQVPAVPSPYPLAAPSLGPPCCEAEIEELLGDARGRLSEYVDFLRLCRRVDAADVYNGYFIYSPLLVAQSDESCPSRLHVTMSDSLEEVSVLRVGGDGGGNQFLLARGDNLPGTVWRWDHEAGVRFDRVANEGVSMLSQSFLGFLERMVEDWTHFVENDRQWKFFSG